MDLQKLHDLQLIDTHLSQIVNRRANLPELIALKDHDATAKKMEEELSRLRAGLQGIENGIADAERTSNERLAKVHKLESQLKTVIAPREAEALQNEIKLLSQEREQADDLGLDLMEQMVEMSAHIDAFMDQQELHTRARGLLEESYRQADLALDSEYKSESTKRETLRSQFNAADLDLYEAKRAKSSGIAVVVIEHHHCSGCHMDLSPGELDTIKNTPQSDIAECPNCARWLVR